MTRERRWSFFVIWGNGPGPPPPGLPGYANEGRGCFAALRVLVMVVRKGCMV